MKVTRYVRILCPSCNGTGETINGKGEVTQIPCKACGGLGIQSVVEMNHNRMRVRLELTKETVRSLNLKLEKMKNYADGDTIVGLEESQVGLDMIETLINELTDLVGVE